MPSADLIGPPHKKNVTSEPEHCAHGWHLEKQPDLNYAQSQFKEAQWRFVGQPLCAGCGEDQSSE